MADATPRTDAAWPAGPAQDGPAPALRLLLRNTLACLADARDATRSLLQRHEVDDTAMKQVLVIVDELASNVVHYAWPDGAEHSFELTVSPQPWKGGLAILVTLSDDGVPFDPTQPRAADADVSLDTMEIGGVGLAIVAQTSDRFEYRREGGRNHVRVVKHVPPRAAGAG